MESILYITDILDSKILDNGFYDMGKEKVVIILQNSTPDAEVSLVLTINKKSKFYSRLRSKMLFRKDEMFKISIDNFEGLLPKEEIVVGKIK